MALDFAAGCIGGCAGVLVGHPFDTVKVRLQTQSTAKPMYNGTFDCFARIIKQESAFGLYKGMSSPLYGLALINAIVFGVQGNVQRRLHNPDSIMSHFMAGSVAGLAQSVICSPMELAKTRMQIQGQGEKLSKKAKQFKGPVECLIKIYKYEGVRGVFRGFGLTVFRETPSFGVYFAAYETFPRLFTRDGEPAGTVVLLIAGGCAGMASWFSTYPIDVIKSRIQADAKHRYNGFLDCCKQSYKEEGIRVFGKGLGSTMLRAFPVNAATFGAVEWVLRNFRNEAEDDECYDWSSYQHDHQHSGIHMNVVPNFPSHP